MLHTRTCQKFPYEYNDMCVSAEPLHSVFKICFFTLVRITDVLVNTDSGNRHTSAKSVGSNMYFILLTQFITCRFLRKSVNSL